jgi:hypothetical protein
MLKTCVLKFTLCGHARFLLQCITEQSSVRGDQASAVNMQSLFQAEAAELSASDAMRFCAVCMQFSAGNQVL